MNRRRIFFPQLPDPGSTAALGKAATHHLSKVLRLKAGDEVVLFDGRGKACKAAIAAVTRREVTVIAGESAPGIPESPLAVTLLQGIGRAGRMDFVVQKATELGVACIRPVTTHRSVVQLVDARATRRRAHWEQIAIAACQQCGRNSVPEILPPMSVRNALEDGDLPDFRIVLDASSTSGLGSESPGESAIAVLAGPEGGLIESEVAASVANDFRPVRLGPRLLRTETAPLVALAILQYRFGDLGNL